MNTYDKRKSPPVTPIEFTRDYIAEAGILPKYLIKKIKGVDSKNQYITQDVKENEEYFVLRLDYGSGDAIHVNACRKAILTYALEIKNHLPKLSEELLKRYLPDAQQGKETKI